MKNNQIRIGAVLGYIQIGLGIIVALIYTPLMIKMLGKAEYGLYNTVASTISMLTILNMGFNSSYVYYYAKYTKNGDEKSVYKLNGLFLLIFSIISVIALVCGVFLTLNLQLVFKNGLIQTEYELAKKLMVLLTVNLAVSFPMSVFSTIISAHERFVVLKVLSIIRTVGSPLLTIPLLLLGYGSIAIVIVTLAVSFLVDITYAIYVLVSLKQRFRFGKLEKGLFGSLFSYTAFIAINIVVDQINLNMDKVLLGRFKGTAVVAVYSLGFTLYNYFQQISTALSSLFVPRVHEIVRGNDLESQRNRLTELFTKVGRVQFLVLGLIASGFVFFGKDFIYLWVGEGYEDSYYVALLLMLPAMIPLTQNIGIEIQRAENKHKFRSIVYLIMALINLILSVFLCQKYGAIGSAIGTAISLLIANGLIINIYYHKKCNIDIVYFWKNILRMSLGLILPVALAVIVSFFVSYNQVWIMVLSIAGYSLVYFVSVFFLSMNKQEKGIVLSIPKKILLKKRN